MSYDNTGEIMHGWVADLYPLCRSITGEAVRKTLAYISNLTKGLRIHSVPAGTQAFDWTVPKEWKINEAFVADESGEKIIDFARHNLHLVGYSVPVDKHMRFNELDRHLYSVKEMPEAIPYVTSYYKEHWGFCLSENQREELRLKPETSYHVKIDSELFDGVLNYADIVIPGKSEDEILLSTYICHPSMANNELSGIAVATALERYIRQKPRYYTYRILFLPETIGAIVYLSKHLEHLKKHVKAGFVLTCIGDDRAYSYLASRYGDTLADRVSKHVLKHTVKEYKSYSYLDRGSDERQFCSPGVDLPVCSIMRSKYAEYPEYHTSLDNLRLVTPSGLQGGYNIARSCIELLEANFTYTNTVLCEPQMGKRGLYPTISTKNSTLDTRKMMNLLSYADGGNDLIEIADIIGCYAGDLIETANVLEKNGLIRR